MPIAHQSLSQQIQVKDLELLKELWEQLYLQDQQFIPCPLAYLERMQRLNYSPNTMRACHARLLRFLNTYRAEGLNAIDHFAPDQVNRYHQVLQQRGLSYTFINSRSMPLNFTTAK